MCKIQTDHKCWRQQSGEQLNLIFLTSDDSFCNEFVRIFLQEDWSLLDSLVHEWLGEHRLVDFVVSVTTITNLRKDRRPWSATWWCKCKKTKQSQDPSTHKIDDDIFSPGGSPFGGNLADVHDCFGIVGIDVEDRSSDNTCHIRAVGRRTRKSRICGESNLKWADGEIVCKDLNECWLCFVANLIVNNYVHCSVGGILRQVAQVECLVHNTLAWKCCITVEQDAHHLNEGLALLLRMLQNIR